MKPETWKAIKEAFAAALELPPSERLAYVSGLAVDHRVEVENLLANYEKARHFMEEPVIAAMGLAWPSGDLLV